MLTFDHIAISAETLQSGVDWVAEALGVVPQGGGEHPLMGTHNRLLGMGDLYLEVIAVNPAAPPPVRARWFGLDGFVGRPRVTNWIARCGDLEGALAASPAGSGVPLALTRGDLRWRMAVPEDGLLPYEAAFPALIQWEGTAHPTQRLPDSGLRLTLLEIAHPEAGALRKALTGLFDDPRIVIVEGTGMAMRATFDTPDGPRVLA